MIKFMTRTKVVSAITLSERGFWKNQNRIIESTIKLEYIVFLECNNTNSYSPQLKRKINRQTEIFFCVS